METSNLCPGCGQRVAPYSHDPGSGESAKCTGKWQGSGIEYAVGIHEPKGGPIMAGGGKGGFCI